MAEYLRRGHPVTDLKYHFVWATKYRFPVLQREVAVRARDVIREVCEAREITVVKGVVSRDHVHVMVSAPPQLAPAQIMRWVKGRSSRKLQQEFAELRRPLLGAASVGAGLFLREFWDGDGRDDQGVSGESPGSRAGPGFPRGGARVSAADRLQPEHSGFQPDLTLPALAGSG